MNISLDMDKRGLFGLIGLGIALLVVGFFIFWSVSSSNTDGVNETEQKCVRVETECCSCRSGGEDVCVLKKDVGDYEVNESECDEVMFCAQVYNCNPGNCEFIDGECSFTE